MIGSHQTKEIIDKILQVHIDLERLDSYSPENRKADGEALGNAKVMLWLRAFL